MKHDNTFVSILIPCRNEADFIEQCIRSVLSNDYPSDYYEVLLLDGMSDDGTREIIEQIEKESPNVRLLDNPQKVVGPAMNIGIAAAKGDIIIRIDGHAEVPSDFISKNIQYLVDAKEAWCVGGPIKTIGTNFMGTAIAAAMSSPVGVGNAMFRLGNYEGYVDTIAFGAYWKWVFDKIGLFDEQLVRNQDDELNMRLVLAGGKIFMTPQIHSTYYSRGSIPKLWRQYFQYGFWRIRTMQKHKRPATIRQVIPLGFVLSILMLGLGSFFFRPILYLFGLELLLYGLGVLAGAVHVGMKSGFACGLLAPLIFFILHFAYGIGSLWGIIRFVLMKGKGIDTQKQKISR